MVIQTPRGVKKVPGFFFLDRERQITDHPEMIPACGLADGRPVCENPLSRKRGNAQFPRIMPMQRRSPRTALTLIELIIVIGGLLFLAALLLPIIAPVRI